MNGDLPVRRILASNHAIPVRLDVALWPRGEEWCQELEVYHNPLACRPLAFDLLPGGVHYFELEGELVFRSMWENTVISSLTEAKFRSK